MNMSWSERGKNLPKNLLKNVQGEIILALLNFSIYFCFSKTTYLGSMISAINKAIELSAGAKICLKLIKKHIHSYIKFQNYFILSTYLGVFLI